jgi:stage IV sporulation protein FB
LIKLYGIEIRFHPLFSLLMLGAVLTGYFAELLTLFAIVLIHELGHVAAAKSFGWNVIRIEMLPFGGVAETDDRGRASAWEEAAVALAGPLQNGWMAVFAMAMGAFGLWETEWLAYFIRANTIIGLFNLLPILPLDGGKLLQSFVCRWLPYYRALLVCSSVSLLMSALLAAASLAPVHSGGIHLNMLAIAMFLFVSNWQSYRSTAFLFMRFLMNREPKLEKLILQGTLAQPIVAFRNRKLSDIVRLFMRDKYHIIYVMNERGRIQAVLPEQKLLDAYFRDGQSESALSDVFVLE